MEDTVKDKEKGYTENLRRRVKPGRPSVQQSAQLTELILDESTSFFVKFGFSKTNLDKIVAKLHLSKRTIYSRFPSKADLFYQVSMRALQEQLHKLTDIELPEGSAKEKLQYFAEEQLRVLLDPDLVALERAVAAETMNHADMVFKIHKETKEKNIMAAARMLAKIAPEKKADQRQLERDAEIFSSMVILPALRDRTHGFASEELTEQDLKRVERQVEIFAAGYLQ